MASLAMTSLMIIEKSEATQPSPAPGRHSRGVLEAAGCRPEKGACLDAEDCLQPHLSDDAR